MGRGGRGTVDISNVAKVIQDIPDETRLSIIKNAKSAFHFVCSHAVWFGIALLLPSLLRRYRDATATGGLVQLWEHLNEVHQVNYTLIYALGALASLCIFLGLLIWYLLKPRPVWLVDFYCFRPPDRMEVPHRQMSRGIRLSGLYNEASIAFVDKVLEISGLGNRTYLPDSIKQGMWKPVHVNMKESREETEMALFACIRHVLKRTGIKASQIDGLIVNCSAFNPTPSLSATVVNEFKLKESIRSFNLSGMGCAASVIAIDLAQELLKNNANMRVLVAGTENIFWNLYNGNQRSMLITNCIFRLGGVAYILSNHPADRAKAKYRLKHVVRTHLGSDDEAYNAVIQKEDDEGILGVKIGKELMSVAGRALTANIMRLGPKVLPISEQLIFAGNLVARKVLGMKLKPYTPDFKMAFDHFCIHPGGKAVIDGVGKQLNLTQKQCMPMLKPFERYGNTSSSSTWYAWGYVETEHGVKKGDRLWQLAFGSGFKCCSAVWVATRSIDDKHDAWTDKPSC